MARYRKTATVEAKLFEPGDEDGKVNRYGYLDTLRADNQNDFIPYISTLENQQHKGEFYENYVCTGIDGERWLVAKDIFERTYEEVSE